MPYKRGGKLMDWGLIFVAVGIAVAGYFIGDGLKNFKNPHAKNLIDTLNEEDEHEFIKENDGYIERGCKVVNTRAFRHSTCNHKQ